ncbi:hypothetical protein [Rheinheimera sp. WS51]|uniref:hypothetical protein n=1 Tax=Rheinheimera sp. WS51 TaxID=3425886 RepID=UPI003D8D83F7
MNSQPNIFPIVDTITKVLLREHYQPTLAIQFYHLLTNTEQTEEEKTDNFTYAVIDLLEDLEQIYINDYAFDIYDAFEINNHFIDGPLNCDVDEYEDADSSVLFALLNRQFRTKGKKLLLIHTSGCELIFLPLPIKDARTLQITCLQFDYFKVSDYIDDTSVIFKDPFEVLPVLYKKTPPQTPVLYQNRKISFDLFFQVLETPLLDGLSAYSTWNTLEESLEILKEEGDKPTIIQKLTRRKPCKKYAIFIKNTVAELFLNWTSDEPDDLLVYYISKQKNANGNVQKIEQPYFLKRDIAETEVIPDEHPLYSLWDRSLTGLENFEYYRPQIDYAKLWELVNMPAFQATDYETPHKHPNKPIQYYIRHIAQSNYKKEVFPVLAINVGSDYFYYRAYEKDYLVFFSPENDEFELILTQQSMRYFWAVTLFNDLYEIIKANKIIVASP